MAFGFISGQEYYKSFQSLIKRNQGLFVSEKQANFWRKKIKNTFNNYNSTDILKLEYWKTLSDNFTKKHNLDIPIGVYPIEVLVYTQFGSKQNSFIYLFLIDTEGVYAKYKIIKNKISEEFKTDREINSLYNFYNEEKIKEDKEKQEKLNEIKNQGFKIPHNERIVVSGTIERIYMKDGYRWVMLIQTDKIYKTWGTVPDELKKICHQYKFVFDDFIGFDITFEARVNQSNDDPLFTFFSRPTKFKVSEDHLAMAILSKEF